MRVYELAKELGFDSKEFIEKLKGLNVSVRSHLSFIDDETAEIVRHELAEQKERQIQENVVEIEFPLTVKELAVKLSKKPSEIIPLLLRKGKMLNINQNIDKDTAVDIGRQFGVNLKEKLPLEDKIIQDADADTALLKPRVPIVTFMGHIDHGKTTLLDYIRNSKIADKESGSITQHIGAYQVDIPKGKIIFIDTPGHETFTAMRARGANITDIVVLVVAADEGVKPQTEEAISHVRAAGVPIIVAINKIDRPNAQPDMVKQQLSKLDLSPEEWGGKTITVEVSAKTGESVDKLLEMILLEAELLELKADFEKPAQGVVLESRVSKGLGPVAAVVVKSGQLKVRDYIVCGDTWGRIKVIRDDRGNTKDKVFASAAVEIVGLQDISSSGDKFFVVPTEKEAQQINQERQQKKKGASKKSPVHHMGLEDLYKQMGQKQAKSFRLVIKADTYGTLEAITDVLDKIDLKEIKIEIIHKSIGMVNLSDVILAEASDAMIVGFKVGKEPRAIKQAQDSGVQIKTYQVIYGLVEDIKAGLEGLLDPEVKRVFLGRVRVKQVFNVSKAGIIAGSIVEKGKVIRNSPCTVKRDGQVVFEGKVESLKRFKDDVREVAEGFECGIDAGFNEIKEGDIIEAYKKEVTSRKVNL